MGSFCSSPSKVTQEQTYNPDPFAKGMIQNALMTAGNVAQTPFHTPQAPVAGFSGQQNQAFNLANNVPGAAQPYLDQASRYMSGQGVGDFYNPFAANVMANLKDVFGQQMSDTTGKLTNAAGGVGADRIAVGQAELAREQGLAAGQTAANLWQPALSASQNAGYGMGNLGQLNQATQMQGVNQLLTTGGLQQQLQQAQMNAPYQQQLAQIQWPYQNAQFLAGITGALAPGMGSQQTGSTTYPQQSPWGTVAGLGMAGAGAYGLYNQQQQPQQTAARGGRMYADGGDVNPFGLIDISRQGLIPNMQLQPIHAPNPMAQTQAPPSSPSALGIGKDMMQMYGAGRGAASLFGPGKAAAEVPHEAAPLGGASYEDFLAANAPEAAAEGGGLWDSVAGAGSNAMEGIGGALGSVGEGISGALESAAPYLLALLGLSTGGRAGNPYASGGRVDYADGGEVEWPPMRWDIPLMALGPRMGPGGIRVTPQTNPALRYRGRFANEATMRQHPARQAFPEIAVANSMMHADPFGDRARFARPAIAEDSAPQISRGIPEDSQPVIEHPDWMAHRMPPAPDLTEMGRMAPAPASAAEMMGMGKAALPAPRPRRVVIEEPPRRNILRGHASGFADGGDVEEGIEPPLFLQSGMEEVPPTPSPMRSSREAKPLGAPRGAALREDIENLRYLRDNPGVALSAAPSAVGNIVGAAMEQGAPIEARREKSAGSFYPRQLHPISESKPQPQKTWLPGVGNIFDMSAHAEEAEDPKPEAPIVMPAPEEAAIIEKLNGQIAGKRVELERATNMKVRTDKNGNALPVDVSKKTSAVQAAKDAIAALQGDLSKLEGPESPLGIRRTAAQKAHDAALERWNQRQEELAGKRTAAVQPYAIKYPDRQAMVQKYGPGASAATGALMGTLGAMKGKHVLPALGAGVVGGLEGGYASLWPTLQDAEFLPPGEANKSALSRLYDLDPDTWKRAGAGVMTHAPLAAGASLFTSKGSELAGRSVKGVAQGLTKAADWWRKPPSADVAAALPATSTRIRTTFELPDGSTVTRRLVNGKETWHGINEKTGKHGFIAKPDISKAKAGESEHYAGGGTVAFEDRWDPVTKGIQSGLLDPQGENYPSQIAPFASIPMPRSNPFRDEDIGVEAGGDEIPSGNPMGLPRGSGTNPYALPQGRSLDAYAPQQKSLMDSPWMGLLSAGLGTMASAGQRDARGLLMSPMAAIGHGGMEGIKTLQHQREAAMKQQSIDQATRRLDERARMQMAQLDESRQRRMETPRVVGQNELFQPVYGIPDGKGGFVDPVTRKPINLNNFSQPQQGQREAGATIPGSARPTSEEGTNPEILDRVDPGIAATVKAVNDGRQSLQSVPFKERYAVQRLLNQYNPSWDQNLFSQRQRLQNDLSTNGNAGKMILAVNQLIPHLDKLSKTAEELHNQGFTPGNVIKNWAMDITGDPRKKKFDEVREVAAMDAARLLRGTGAMAEKDIEFWRNNLSSANSPKQLQEQINLLSDDLIGARISSIEHSYRFIMRREPPNFVADEAKDARENIKKRLEGVNKGSEAPSKTEAPKDGEIRTNKNGVKGRYNTATKTWQEIP